MRIESRTAACPVVCTVSCSTRTTPGGRARSAVHPASATRAPNPTRRSTSATEPYTPVRKTEMTTIGQNSPATPLPRTAVPSGVSSSPASDRIGTSVPSAVVASATPRSHPSASTPGLLEDRPGGEADRQRHRPAGRAEPERAAGNALLDHLEPGEEEQEHEPEVGEELDVRVGVREAERLGADEDPEDDLDHDGRQEQPADAAARGSPRRSTRRGRGRASGRRVRPPRAQRALRGAIPQELVNEAPGSRRISASPLRNAFGGQVIGSTARLRRLTSGSGSPVKSIR